LLGWSPIGEEEIFTAEELIQQFSLDRVAKNPAVFDIDKLNWLNGFYIRKCPVERITDLAIPFLQKAGYVGEDITEEKYKWLLKVVASVQENLAYVGQITEHVGIFFNDEIIFENDDVKELLTDADFPPVMELFKEKIRTAEILDVDTTKAILKAITKELKLGGKKVYMPIRVALTGQSHGPELYNIIPILGGDRVISRVEATMANL
jgi:nondiscriminating glutamyl-tRNA synthetase